MSPKFYPHLLLLGANLIYAANFTIAKEVMPTYIQPLGFILLRVITGVILFWGFTTAFIKEKVQRKDFIRLALCGVFGVAINQMCFFKGLNWTTPIHGALLMLTTPILVLIISAFFLRETINYKKVIGIGLGLLGAGFLIAYGETSLTFSTQILWGDLFIFINAVSYGIYLVLVKSLMAKYHPLTVVKWAFTFGFFIVLPFGWEEATQIEWSSFPTDIWIAVFYVLFFVTFLTYLFIALALKNVNPSVASTYIYLQPVLATIIAVSFGKDSVDINKLIAALFIFAGVYLVSNTKPLEVGTNT